MDVDSIEFELGSESVGETSESVFAWSIRGVPNDGHVSQRRGDEADLSRFATLDHFLAHCLAERQEVRDEVLAGRRTQAVQACIQYDISNPRTKSSFVISTKNPGAAPPAQRNVASGTPPS